MHLRLDFSAVTLAAMTLAAIATLLLLLPRDAPASPSLLAPPSSCPGQLDANASDAVQEEAMRCLHAYARGAAGLPAQTPNASLGRSANAKSADMLGCGQLSPTACGRAVTDWAGAQGYLTGRCWWFGENIAWAWGSHRAPRTVMEMWLDSSANTQMLLLAKASEIGVGMARGSFLGYPEAVVWTAHFGQHC